ISVIIITIIFNGCIFSDNQKDETSENTNHEDEEKNSPPITDTKETKTNGWNGTIHYFIGIGFDIDGEIVLYEWDFNGDQIIDWNSTINGNATYIYESIGEYNAVFTITDNEGSISKETIKIHINESLPFRHSVNFNDYKDGYDINGNLNISGNAEIYNSNDDILSIQISINNSEWINVNFWRTSENTYDWYYIIDTTNFSNGNYSISIKVKGKIYGEIIETSLIKIKNDNEHFLLVEWISYHYTELISGNYTDGHTCFDFPMYFIDEENKTIDVWWDLSQDNFILAYGSGMFADGLVDSGGATGLNFFNILPFNKIKKVFMGNNSFNVSLTITENFEVYINDSDLLESGDSIMYTYDYNYEYQNHNSNETCIIRHYGVTVIKNYGIWKKSWIQ
ncbi:MAG: hypothetical protein JSV49_04495, partial [Thermoplasmata archaeon]